MHDLRLKTLFIVLAMVSLALALGLVAALSHYNQASEQVAGAENARYQAYLLADELRQSSDDLTRLARTYVVTGNPAYEQQYWDILDIRNGKKARPRDYHRIYWDFVAAGENKPREDDVTISLLELMTQAGFTPEEFAKLDESAGNSDALVQTETIAMNAVKGRFDDGQGGFSRTGEPDMTLARQLMHSPDYHAYKAQIMRPLDEFYELVEERTQGAVDAAQSDMLAARSLVWSTIAANLLVLCAALFLVYRSITRQIGGEPNYGVDIVRQVAAGDLTLDIKTKPGDTGSMLAALRGMTDQLQQIIGDVRGASNAMSSASEEVSATAQNMSQASSEQAASVEETSSSIEQMSASINQNTENAKVTNDMSAQAASQAVEGGQAVGETVDAMKQITDKISIIDDIAYQTNLLALNAAIEAARAGEHGKGFAVVAAEVRKLAERSQVAAQEIGETAKGSVSLAEKAGKLLDEIVPGITKTSELVQEITAASTEQASGASQINTAMEQLNQITQQNASSSEELVSTSEEMSSQAQQLQELMAFFKVDENTTTRPQLRPVAGHKPAAAQ